MMSRNKALIILLGILLLATGVRSYHITTRSLWFDEAFSWRLIQFPFEEMIARDASDVHPPLYYIILKGWAAVFGTSLLALRSFSAVFAVAAIAMTYVFASYGWRSRSVGLLSAGLMAVAGWQIQYAWEARMYTLGIFFSLLTSWLLLRLIRASKTFGHTAGILLAGLYGILAALFAYTHYFAFFTLAAHGLFILIILIQRTRWRLGEMLQSPLLWHACIAAFIAVGMYLPWIPVFLAQNAQVQENYWVPSIGGWSIPDTFYHMVIPTGDIPPHTGVHIVLTALPIVITVSVWIWLVMRYARKSHVKTTQLKMRNTSAVAADNVGDIAWLTVLCGVIPFIFAITLSLLAPQSIYEHRFLVFTHVFILIALSVAVLRIPHRTSRRVIVAIMVSIFTLASVNYWFILGIPDKPGAHGAATYVFEHRNASEPVYVSSPFVYFAIEYYAQQDFGGVADPLLVTDKESLHFSGGPILTEADTSPTSVLSAGSANTFWLVDTTGFGESELFVPAPWRSVDRQVFSEIFPHQKEVIVHKYVR